jgi:circadian clock protein KaiB
MPSETRAGDQAVDGQPPVDGFERYSLCLYVSGMTPRSTTAIARLKVVCEKHLAGHYDLEVIDIYQQPALARADQIIATPTLIKRRPAPLRRLVGSLADTPHVLAGLELPVSEDPSSWT